MANRTSTRMKRAWIVALAASGLVVVGIWVSGCLDVDRCPDRGGRWSHARGECEFE
jgi:hypothetical protein